MQISLKPASKETLVIREFELSQSLEVCDNQPSFAVNLRPFWILGFLCGFRHSPQRFLGFHTSRFQIDYLTLIKRKCFGKWFSWSHTKKGLTGIFSLILRVISHRSTRTIVLSAKWISAQNKLCLIIWRKNSTFLFLMRSPRGISLSEFFVFQLSRLFSSY